MNCSSSCTAAWSPRTYLEIGVNAGASLSLSRTRSIGVDPFFTIRREQRVRPPAGARPRATSSSPATTPLAHFDGVAPDLTFIDGMHLAEYALRDFINTERHAHPASVIVFDDMLPRVPVEAAARPSRRAVARARGRATSTRCSTPCASCAPTWSSSRSTPHRPAPLMILLPDSSSTTLATAYDDLVEAYVVPDPQAIPDEVLGRTRAFDPEDLLRAPIWDGLQRLREKPAAEARPEVARLLAEAGLATPR